MPDDESVIEVSADDIISFDEWSASTHAFDATIDLFMTGYLVAFNVDGNRHLRRISYFDLDCPDDGPCWYMFHWNERPADPD